MPGKFQITKKSLLLALLFFAVLMGLGVWQVQRGVWKTALLAEIHSRMEQPAVPLPEKIDDPGAWEYRRVTLAGSFLYKNEFLLKPRTRDGVSGYHMLVPFQRASGGIVMIDRGWISDALLPRAVRPAGLMQIEGIVQLPHRGAFTPANDPQKNDWYWADLPAMAAAAKLKPPAPVLVVIAARQPDIWPAGGKVAVNLRNDHRQYAIFWFAMAGVWLAIFLASRRGRE